MGNARCHTPFILQKSCKWTKSHQPPTKKLSREHKANQKKVLIHKKRTFFSTLACKQDKR